MPNAAGSASAAGGDDAVDAVANAADALAAGQERPSVAAGGESRRTRSTRLRPGGEERVRGLEVEVRQKVVGLS